MTSSMYYLLSVLIYHFYRSEFFIPVPLWNVSISANLYDRQLLSSLHLRCGRGWMRGSGMLCGICLTETVLSGNELSELYTVMRETAGYLHWSNELRETWSLIFVTIPNYVMTAMISYIICHVYMYILLINWSLSLWLPITVCLQNSISQLMTIQSTKISPFL